MSAARTLTASIQLPTPDGGRMRSRRCAVAPPAMPSLRPPSGSNASMSEGRPEQSSVYGMEGRMSPTANTVNSGTNTVNVGAGFARLRKGAEVIDLQVRIAEAARRLPPKELERATGLPAREAEELATAMRLPRLPNLQKLTRHDPACLEAVVRFLAGQTGTGAVAQDPARVIAELIRRLQA
jgi:hypothetical protein